MLPFAILIGGATATGKTRLAFEIQEKIPSIILNADSMQVYDDLKTLTNMPNKKDIIKHSCNLFGYIQYPNKCNLGNWHSNVKSILEVQKNKIPIFVGGTGLYLDSLNGHISDIPKINPRVQRNVEKIHTKFGNEYFFQKLQKIDKPYSEIISKNDSQRLIRAICVKISTGKKLSYWHLSKAKKLFKKILYVSITKERQELYEVINLRCKKILNSDIKDEIARFMRKKKNINHPLHKSIGLTILFDFFSGKIGFDKALEIFSRDTRQYAKRQFTWFKNRSFDSKKLEYEEAKKFLLKNI